MNIPEVDNALSVIKEQIASGTLNPEVESYLTLYTCILIISAFEKTIKQAIQKHVPIKLENVSPDEFVLYLSEMSTYHCKYFKINDLNGYLKKIHAPLSLIFHSKFSSEEETAYSNIIINRHRVAHNHLANITMTFRDIERDYPKAIKVIEAFVDTIDAFLT